MANRAILTGSGALFLLITVCLSFFHLTVINRSHECQRCPRPNWQYWPCSTNSFCPILYDLSVILLRPTTVTRSLRHLIYDIMILIPGDHLICCFHAGGRWIGHSGHHFLAFCLPTGRVRHQTCSGVIREVGWAAAAMTFITPVLKAQRGAACPFYLLPPLPGKGILRLQQIRWAHILSDSSDFRTTECFCQLNSRHLLPFFAEGFFKDNVSQDLTPLKTIASLIPWWL